jgi:hypothetical protein
LRLFSGFNFMPLRRPSFMRATGPASISRTTIPLSLPSSKETGSPTFKRSKAPRNVQRRRKGDVVDIGGMLVAHEEDLIADMQGIAVMRCDHLPRADLRAGTIHDHADAAAGLRFGGGHMRDHLAPMRRIVMRALDAHRIGAVLGEAQDEVRLLRRFGGEGDEDAADPPLRWRPNRMSVFFLSRSSPRKNWR